MSTLDFDSFVLAAATDDLAAEPAARDHADAVEFRLDLATDPLDQLAAYDGDLPLIVTNRAAWEGGEADDESRRLDTLDSALDHEAVAAVDLECGALDGSVEAAARPTSRLSPRSTTSSRHPRSTSWSTCWNELTTRATSANSR